MGSGWIVLIVFYVAMGAMTVWAGRRSIKVELKIYGLKGVIGTSLIVFVFWWLSGFWAVMDEEDRFHEGR